MLSKRSPVKAPQNLVGYPASSLPGERCSHNMSRPDANPLPDHQRVRLPGKSLLPLSNHLLYYPLDASSEETLHLPYPEYPAGCININNRVKYNRKQVRHASLLTKQRVSTHPSSLQI